MGCGRSFFKVGGHEVYISEAADDIACVCTFDENHPEWIGADTAFAFALLGVAMRMTKDGHSGSVHRVVPHAVQDRLRALLGVEATHPEGTGETTP